MGAYVDIEPIINIYSVDISLKATERGIMLIYYTIVGIVLSTSHSMYHYIINTEYIGFLLFIYNTMQMYTGHQVSIQSQTLLRMFE